MRFRRLLLLAALASPLAACQTMTPEERRAADETTCAGYGFPRGSDAIAQCVQKMQLNRRG